MVVRVVLRTAADGTAGGRWCVWSWQVQLQGYDLQVLKHKIGNQKESLTKIAVQTMVLSPSVLRNGGSLNHTQLRYTEMIIVYKEYDFFSIVKDDNSGNLQRKLLRLLCSIQIGNGRGSRNIHPKYRALRGACFSLPIFLMVGATGASTMLSGDPEED